jgi:hypothetical protein
VKLYPRCRYNPTSSQCEEVDIPKEKKTVSGIGVGGMDEKQSSPPEEYIQTVWRLKRIAEWDMSLTGHGVGIEEF